jgi:hypothetical protein
LDALVNDIANMPEAAKEFIAHTVIAILITGSDEGTLARLSDYHWELVQAYPEEFRKIIRERFGGFNGERISIDRKKVSLLEAFLEERGAPAAKKMDQN